MRGVWVSAAALAVAMGLSACSSDNSSDSAPSGSSASATSASPSPEPTSSLPPSTTPPTTASTSESPTSAPVTHRPRPTSRPKPRPTTERTTLLGAPVVRHPLRLSDALAEPAAICALLRRTDLARLGLSGTLRPQVNPHSCNFFQHGTQPSFALQVDQAGGGLDGPYGNHQQDPASFDLFRPTTVAGYPGVYVHAGPSDQSTCQLFVGTGANSELQLTGFGPGPSRRCQQQLSRVAGAVLDALKAHR